MKKIRARAVVILLFGTGFASVFAMKKQPLNLMFSHQQDYTYFMDHQEYHDVKNWSLLSYGLFASDKIKIKEKIITFNLDFSDELWIEAIIRLVTLNFFYHLLSCKNFPRVTKALNQILISLKTYTYSMHDLFTEGKFSFKKSTCKDFIEKEITLFYKLKNNFFSTFDKKKICENLYNSCYKLCNSVLKELLLIIKQNKFFTILNPDIENPWEKFYYSLCKHEELLAEVLKLTKIIDTNQETKDLMAQKIEAQCLKIQQCFDQQEPTKEQRDYIEKQIKYNDGNKPVTFTCTDLLYTHNCLFNL
jgi:hypothetical protein